MRFSWRRSKSLGPLRLTWSKRGLSTSVGKSGLRITSGPTGVRATAGRFGFRLTQVLRPASRRRGKR
jgi:hypothetical protein